MADTKVSALTAATAALVAMELPVNDAGTSKKATIAQITTLLQTLGMPRISRLNSTHSNGTATCTIVSDLSETLEAGTYAFEYYIRARSSTATVSPMFALNFTGTATANWWFEYADASATLLAAIGTADDIGATGFGFAMRMAQKTFATTAANMGVTGAANAVSAVATDILYKITGLIVVTASGSLDLYHGSEGGAASTSVEVGTSLIVTRTA